jgi:hypothetical protein
MSLSYPNQECQLNSIQHNSSLSMSNDSSSSHSSDSTELLSNNRLFDYFLHSSYYSLASSHNYILCVPANQSLKVLKLSNDILLTHILTQSPYYKGEYITLNQKIIELSNNKLICKQNFPRPRVVSLLSEELYYDENFNSFKLFKINFPLEGKIPLNYYNTITAQLTLTNKILHNHDNNNNKTGINDNNNSIDYAIESRSIENHAETFNKYFAANLSANLVVSITKFVGMFNSSYVLVKGFLDHAGNKIRAQTSSVLSECIKLLKGVLDKSLVTNQVSFNLICNEFECAIEALLYSGINHKIETALNELYQAENDSTNARIQHYQSLNLSFEELGVEIPLENLNLHTAIHKLDQINSSDYATPLLKLICLYQVNQLIVQSINQSKQVKATEESSSSSSPSAVESLGADEIIPLFLYVCLRSKVNNFHSLYHYLSSFEFSSQYSQQSVQKLRLFTANLKAIIQLIDNDQVLHNNSNKPAPTTNNPMGIISSNSSSGGLAIPLVLSTARDSSNSHAPFNGSHDTRFNSLRLNNHNATAPSTRSLPANFSASDEHFLARQVRKFAIANNDQSNTAHNQHNNNDNNNNNSTMNHTVVHAAPGSAFEVPEDSLFFNSDSANNSDQDDSNNKSLGRKSTFTKHPAATVVNHKQSSHIIDLKGGNDDSELGSFLSSLKSSSRVITGKVPSQKN